tara:strand:+ start:1101 stop:2045 length:945 start_codon:yes stop_codon:yes gene_type:complete
MKASTRSILRIVFYPLVLIRREIAKRRLHYLGLHNPKKLASILHKDYCKRDINWNSPRDLNEKINWLKFNTDTSPWSDLSDKYKVRSYVEKCGLGDLLVELYGVWENADDINFDKLPNSFVLKANNGSATVLLVKDKTTLDLVKIRTQLKKWQKSRFGIMEAEPHYLSLKPCIIAEQLLENDNSEFSTSLIDYKIWCFNGEPYSIWTCSNRQIGGATYVASHDMNWKVHPERSVFTDHYRQCTNNIPRPKSLEQMIDACRILAKDFPQVRMDFYECQGKAYFGEMTFTSFGGYMDFYSHKYLLELGAKVKLTID